MKDAPDAGTVLMQALEEAKTAISAFSGLRNEFIRQGWPEDQAGQMVIVMMQTANINAAKAVKGG